MAKKPLSPSIVVKLIERRIYLIRAQKVMLDSDLAELYDVPAFRLNEAVKRKAKRFPADFMFRLTKQEMALTSQFAMSKIGRGGPRTPPHTFPEHGVGMLSAVLNKRRSALVD